MLHAIILGNSHSGEQGGREMSWMPLISMKFMVSIITWNSKIPDVCISTIKGKNDYIKPNSICNKLL
jgi:hypothetical protein